MEQVQFSNHGVVTRDSAFKKIVRDCFYLETDHEFFRKGNYRYLYEMKDGEAVDPPSGVRSSVPLGGLGAGTVELRADGRFMDWNIFNNTPANNHGVHQHEKTQLDDALMALWTRRGDERNVKVLRTEAPYDLPSVEQVDYAGAFPVSRLVFTDSELPLEATLYAYSEFRIRQPERSATPCALFSLRLHNPTDQPVDASFLFSVPNPIQGRFSADRGLRLSREGSTPVSGDMTLMADGADRVSFMAGETVTEIWAHFTEKGRFDDDMVATEASHGAISASAVVEPGQTRVVTIALAWYFPHRLFYADAIGNYYANLFDSSVDVAGTALGRLDETWAGILEWNRSCMDNSLPEWLQDALVNSAGTMFKTSLWSRDGRYRQFESFSCWDIDAIHIHFARSLPYELFFPELKENLFELFAKVQQDDGYIHEQYGHKAQGTHFDQPHGRTNGDSCTAFILGVYMSHRWRDERGFNEAMWPHVKRAAEWQMERAKKFGLPDHLVATYDLSGFHTKDLVSYNGFLHLATMRAAEELARVYEEEAFAAACRESFERGRGVLMENLWADEYFRCWWNADQPPVDKLHVDTLFGQLWSYLLGLGDLAEPDAFRSHLRSERKYADSPYGLQVIVDPAEPRGNEPPRVEEFLKVGSVDIQRKYNGAHLNRTVWQVGSINWTTMNLFLNQQPDEALAQAKKVVNHWRLTLNDQWDYRDLSAVWDGHPYCNSHYGRQLMFWAIPMALAGQDYSVAEQRLSFSPRCESPYRLPFFTPQANGVLEAEAGEPMKLRVIAGQLELRELLIGGKVVAGDVDLASGDVMMLD